MTQDAPLFNDITATAPGRAYRLTAADGVGIRAGVWHPVDGGKPRGTVLLFPGRSEYIEKYGPAAAEFTARGFACVVVDWRGQGLADKLAEDPSLGHVGGFADYQLDVQAVLGLVAELELPEPLFLIGHSMGGAIAFRALQEGLDAKAVCLSAPMMGINIAAALLPIAWGLGWASGLHAAGALRYIPGGKADSYVMSEPFDNNLLTTDTEMYDFMRRQLSAHPELGLGAPSVGWLYSALLECRTLAALPSPSIPALCFLGTREKIVDAGAIRRRMATWPTGRLIEVDGGEHEVMMERPELRQQFYTATAELFEVQCAPGTD